MNYTLKSFNTGQITLPKKWRDRFDTKSFIAEEKEDGLLIRPILPDENTEIYYENNEGFGIFAPQGIDPESIINTIKKLHNG